jgi:hypothetical protein
MKNEDKKMYVVRGSEDGNLGVFSNKKLAYECALDYVKDWDYKIKSYSKVCKELNQNWFCSMTNFGMEDCMITCFWLNNQYWKS